MAVPRCWWFAWCPRSWAKAISRSWGIRWRTRSRRSAASWIICALIGTSKENAKEVKLFGLGGHLHDRYALLTGQIIRKNIRLTRRRLPWGSIFAVFGSLGYYASYVFLVWQALQGRITIGTLIFLTGAIAGSSTQLQGVFSLFSHIADQALHLTDLIDFLRVQPNIRSRPNAIPAPRPIRDGFDFRNVSFHYPGSERLVLKNLNFRLHPGEHVALVGENGQGKTTLVKLLSRLYDPTARHHLSGWSGSARLQRRGAAQGNRRHFSGFRALRHAGADEHRRGANRGC